MRKETMINKLDRKPLEVLADRGEVLDYLITRFKGNHRELAHILEHGFDRVDYESIEEYLNFGALEQTQKTDKSSHRTCVSCSDPIFGQAHSQFCAEVPTKIRTLYGEGPLCEDCFDQRKADM